MTETERAELKKVCEGVIAGDTAAQAEFARLATPAAYLDLLKGIEGLSRAIVATARRR